MAEEKLTPDQIAVANLSQDDFFTSYASNLMKGSPGRFDEYAVKQLGGLESKAIAGEAGVKTRREMEAAQNYMAAQEGYTDTIEVNNSQVKFRMYQIVVQSLEDAKLGDLETVVKEKGAKLTFEVPEELRKYSKNEIIEKIKAEGLIDAQGRIDPSKLSQEYKNVLGMQEALAEQYQQAGIETLYKQIDFYGKGNAIGEQIAKSYEVKDNKGRE